MTYPQQPPDPYQQPAQQYPPVSGAPVSGNPVSGYPGYPAYPPPQQYPVMPYAPPPQVVVVQTPQVPNPGLAVASMVLAILGLISSCCSFGIFSILAVIFGHMALHETRNGAKSGQGMAQAGLVMGYVIVIPAILFSIWVVFGAGLAAIQGNPEPIPS